MNLTYVLPRVIRHFLPEKVTRALLLRGLIIRPGLETRAPEEAAVRYERELNEMGVNLMNKRIFVFGYGGRFALACNLLKLGAGHVTLCEYSHQPDERANALLLPEFGRYLTHSMGKTLPKDEWITLLQGDIRELVHDPINHKSDIVLSTSVFEHLTDPAGILDALVKLTAVGGTHLHYIDLRDHFFKYPFEMLTYPEKTWASWLNPTSHLNRWRLPAYRKIFEDRFKHADVLVFESKPDEWAAIEDRVLPEFKTGDPQVDSVTQIRVTASL